MKSNKRFIKSVLESAQKCETEMPWTRGKRRSAFIVSRSEPPALRRARTA